MYDNVIFLLLRINTLKQLKLKFRNILFIFLVNINLLRF